MADKSAETVTGTDETAAPPVAETPATLTPGDASTALEETVAETTEQRVRRWVAENLAHGRIARDVELWNELQAAIPALVATIDA